MDPALVNIPDIERVSWTAEGFSLFQQNATLRCCLETFICLLRFRDPSLSVFKCILNPVLVTVKRMFELQNSPSLQSITKTILSHFHPPLILSTCLAKIHSTVKLTSKWPLWNKFMSINLRANYFNSSDLRVQPILSSLIYYACLATWPADNSKISSFKISKLPFFLSIFIRMISWPLETLLRLFSFKIFYHNKQARLTFTKKNMLIYRSTLEFIYCRRTLMKWKLHWRRNQENIQLRKC